MIIKMLSVGSLGTNCYIVGKDGEMAIIDPGADSERILKIVEENDYKIKYIFLTHCHYDHIGAVEEIKSKTGAYVAIGEKEKENYLSNAVNLNSYFGNEKSPKEPDKLLVGGEKISVGNVEFEVIETPGHTSGGICLRSGNVLFSGDTLFKDSIGRTDFPTGSLSMLLKSVNEKIFTLPGDTVVYPGHGAETTVEYEMKNNMFFK